MRGPDPYAPIHVSSCFSLLRGCLTPEQICRWAREQDHRAVGLVDINNFYGLVRFLQAAEREGVRPVVGMVLAEESGGAPARGPVPRRRSTSARPEAAPPESLSPPGEPASAGRPAPPGGRSLRPLCTAYVLDRRGFTRLNELVTALKTGIPAASGLPGGGGGDLVTGLREGGWEGLALLVEDPKLLERLRARSREGLYVKVSYGRSFAALARYAREAGLPLCAVNEALYLEEEDAKLCDLLRAIDLCRPLDELPAGERVAPRRRAAGAGEMERFFSAVPEALENARALAEEAEAGGILSPGYVFPSFNGLAEEESFALLKKLCLEGVSRRYGEASPGARQGRRGSLEARPPASLQGAVGTQIAERLNYELSIIRRKGFAGYFLVVHDIVARCPRTCGRGSSAASIVSYLLGITHVDPLRYNLFFERFLNLERKDPPDIDVDFPWDERDKALGYVFERYRGRAGMVADHVTFGPRSCIREPAEALGLPEAEIGRMVRFYRHGERDRIPPYLLRAAERLRGLPRHLGTHPGGVVITPQPITRYTHLQTSPLGYPVIAWEKDAAETAGLVKIDLLGNRSLGVLRDAMALVNGSHPAGAGEVTSRGVAYPLSWEGFDPLEDAETRELVARGRTLGVFYIESPATRQLLRKMRRGDFENLVIASSIIRPAANRFIEEFVRRLHGAPHDPLHPLLEETLRETLGIMVYQEDVSRVAIDLAGFSPGEADQLRKVLTKKDRALRLPDFRERFFRRGRSRGVGEAVLEKVWEMILSFDGYSFCKAHSASYALVSYRLAYLRRFHPLEFLAAVINNGGGFYTRQTYLDECRRLGFPILGPDVNRSQARYTVEYPLETPSPAGTGLSPQGMEGGALRPLRPLRGLRVGLGQLRELGEGRVERILEEREKRGPFADFRDFLRRLDPGLPEVRVLIRSGALDAVAGGLTRPQLFWAFFRTERENGLFLLPPAPPSIGDYSPARKLLNEVRTLGLIVSCHPLAVFRQRIASLVARRALPPLISSAEMPAWKGRRVTLAGVLVAGKEVPTRRRRPMSFVSFEDEHSLYETVFFPEAFARFGVLIDDGGAFLVTGRVEEDLGAFSLNADGVLGLQRVCGGALEAGETGGAGGGLLT